ncbi:MAG: DNA polymerase III subunit gamma/tau [Bacilli bacterium]|jgi:DNA polymerase-3 subunit gamma/tau|nr:DNA polymerase III subunit gamma/tau [Bacilli bacterium]
MYQALYRKYRPKKFENVVSQTTIIQTLENSIKTSHIGHAYLFSGPRGTGKTTAAKIFARAVNCLNYKDGLCNECKNCIYSGQKECMDIIEIDAASNNGVDEIRELRNKVKILPSELKYKVYIIDEVHMLSIGAFNALLKTLEEPPEHVIFILATTDPQKIPNTIISRCQTFQFKKISPNDIKQMLEKIALNEKIEIEDEVLTSIASASDGGLRDAIGLLDKLSSYKLGKITYNDFLTMNGQIIENELLEFENSILAYKTDVMLEKIENYYNNGKDLVQILKQLIYHLKDILINYYMKNENLEYSEKEIVELVSLLNEKISDIKKSDDIKVYVEILLLHFINQNKTVEKNISREIISEKNSKIIDTASDSDSKPTKEITPINNSDNNVNYKHLKETMLIRAKNTLAEATKNNLNIEINTWKKINDYTFDVNNGYLACELLDGTPRASSNKSLIISYEHSSTLKRMSDHFQKLTTFYNDISNSNKKISFIEDSDWENLKKEYIMLLKSGKKMEIIDEPTEEPKKGKTESSNESFLRAKELFGDLVEIR